MVGQKGHFELKKCTVSGLKRQFDKWHLFSASTRTVLCNFEGFSSMQTKEEGKEGKRGLLGDGGQPGCRSVSKMKEATWSLPPSFLLACQPAMGR